MVVLPMGYQRGLPLYRLYWQQFQYSKLATLLGITALLILAVPNGIASRYLSDRLSLAYYHKTAKFITVQY